MSPAGPAGPGDGGDHGQAVAVALGSNLGDRRENLRYGLRELERLLCRVRSSRVYRSPPAEGVGGGEFLNMCAAGRLPASPPSPKELLRELLHVEIGAGRPTDGREGEPRTLDLDLLLVGEVERDREELELPHPRMHRRGFVLVPLAELLPDWRHPRLGATVRALAAERGAEDIEPSPERELA